MNQLFTFLRQFANACASALLCFRRFAVSAIPRIRRLASCTRETIPFMFALGMLISLQGCAKTYGNALRSYIKAPVCCSSLADLPVESIRLGDKRSFDLDATSPAYQFDSGKSYFRAFALPQGPYPYTVTVRSFMIGDNLKSSYIFFPRIITLDEKHRLVRSTGTETFTLQKAGYLETMLETAGFRHKLEGTLTFNDSSRDERFLVVLTTGDLLQGSTEVSTVGDEPMLNTISVAEKGGEAHVSHAPNGRLTISLSPFEVDKSLDGMAVSGVRKAETEPVPDSHPEAITVRLSSGTAIGELALGSTTEEMAGHLFEKAGAGLGPERKNNVAFAVGAVVIKPARLFTPPGFSCQLYFDDKGILVLFVDGNPVHFPPNVSEFMSRFPEARESGRTLSSYEMQAPLNGCVTLIGSFRTVGDILESAAFGYGCQIKYQ